MFEGTSFGDNNSGCVTRIDILKKGDNNFLNYDVASPKQPTSWQAVGDVMVALWGIDILKKGDYMPA